MFSGSEYGSTSTTVTTGGPPSLRSLAGEPRSVDVSVGSVNGDFSQVRIYRSGGGDSDVLVYSGAPNTTITDPDLLDGVEYTYRFEAVYPRGSASADESILLALPVPTDLVARNVEADFVDLEFTDNANNRTKYGVDIAVDDDGNWTRNNTTTDTVGEGETASISATGLLNGQLYGIRVAVVTEDTEAVDQ
jgi:archaellin